MRAETAGNGLGLAVGEASHCKARTEVLPADAAGNAAGRDAGDARVCAPSGLLQHGGEDLMQLVNVEVREWHIYESPGHADVVPIELRVYVFLVSRQDDRDLHNMNGQHTTTANQNKSSPKCRAATNRRPFLGGLQQPP